MSSFETVLSFYLNTSQWARWAISIYNRVTRWVLLIRCILSVIRLQNLWGPVQKNSGLEFKIIKNFKMATAECYTKHRTLLSKGPRWTHAHEASPKWEGRPLMRGGGRGSRVIHPPWQRQFPEHHSPSPPAGHPSLPLIPLANPFSCAELACTGGDGTWGWNLVWKKQEVNLA